MDCAMPLVGSADPVFGDLARDAIFIANAGGSGPTGLEKHCPSVLY